MKKLISFSALLIFVSAISLSAQNFSGNWGYRTDGNEITVYGDKIQNQNNGGRTGTLKLAVYATSYPYSGGSLNGYNLFERKLDPLDGGYYYYDVSKSGWCTYPPKGRYSITILLMEYASYDYEIVDYITMNRYTSF
jgi:hypothetical protein|tara:strand:- start:40 stop:450 length:411 start_codon:yes stop_codon:yes gene_type:complete